MKVRDYNARHADGQTPPMSTRAPAACGVLRVTWKVVETRCAHVCAFELGHVARHVSTSVAKSLGMLVNTAVDITFHRHVLSRFFRHRCLSSKVGAS